MTGQGIHLSTTSWPHVANRVSQGPLLLVVPLGSCEQHGPHLPFDVDTTVAQRVSEAFVADRADAALAPALGFGASGEHEGFPGTLSIGTAALTSVIVELGRSATRWAERVLFVTGHGGNGDALVGAVSELRREQRDCAWWPCGIPGGDAHAGHTETSLLLALRPGAVDRAATEAGRAEEVGALMPELLRAGVRGVSANGVLGDPTSATREAGAEHFAGLVGGLRSAAEPWRVSGSGRLLNPVVAGARP